MRTKGSIGGHIYSSYLKAGGNWCVVFIIVLLCIGAQLAASGGDYFIAMWVNMEEREHENVSFSKHLIMYTVNIEQRFLHILS